MFGSSVSWNSQVVILWNKYYLNKDIEFLKLNFPIWQVF